MYNIDVSLIKMLTDHYWIKRDNIVQKIDFGGRVFFDKYLVKHRLYEVRYSRRSRRGHDYAYQYNHKLFFILFIKMRIGV